MIKREVAEQHQGPGGELVYSGDDNALFLVVNFFLAVTICWWYFFGDGDTIFCG